MIEFPNAKINLGLNVVRKRPDGYHDLETIFFPIPLKDALEITLSDKDNFKQDGIKLDSPSDKNLVIKAMNALKKDYAIPPLDIHLVKSIPFGAGLGGGSSDASFALKLINSLCELSIENEQLECIAASIGADCPFFIKNKPVLATGIGDQFEPLELSLDGYHICIVKPDVSVSTPEAYSMVKPAEPKISLKEIIRQPVEEWKELMTNDFEMSVFCKYPLIGEIKRRLYNEGAIYASMSGSGSSVFALFKNHARIKQKRLFEDCFVWEAEL